MLFTHRSDTAHIDLMSDLEVDIGLHANIFRFRLRKDARLTFVP